MASSKERSATRLFLHCGWPRTGTTTLQTLIGEHREALGKAGIAYPRQWARSGHDNHNQIAALIEPSSGDSGNGSASGPSARELQRCISSSSGRAVLLSSEDVVSRMVFGPSESELTSLFGALREVALLTCVTTLRRLDDVVTSFHLHHMLRERPLPTPARIFEQGLARTARWPTVMQDVASKADESVYVRYSRDGQHQREILELVGVPPKLRDRMEAKLRSRPRLNARLSRKAATAFVYREALAARAGVPVSSEDLRQLHWSGEMRFSNDMPCELLGGDLRRSLHEAALEAAREAGFTAYTDFFESDEVSAPAATPLHPDALTDEDVDYLIGRLAAARGEAAAWSVTGRSVSRI